MKMWSNSAIWMSRRSRSRRWWELRLVLLTTLHQRFGRTSLMIISVTSGLSDASSTSWLLWGLPSDLRAWRDWRQQLSKEYTLPSPELTPEISTKSSLRCFRSLRVRGSVQLIYLISPRCRISSQRPVSTSQLK